MEGQVGGLNMILCDFCLMGKTLVSLVESFMQNSEILDELRLGDLYYADKLQFFVGNYYFRHYRIYISRILYFSSLPTN